jgi:hypothetical protein
MSFSEEHGSKGWSSNLKSKPRLSFQFLLAAFNLIFVGCAPPDSEKLLSVEIPAIHESSGLAHSSLAVDVLWTHNDSGDEPRVFAIDTEGKLRGICKIEPEAEAHDWEDMAAFVFDNQPWLLLADVGDNARKRRRVRLYIVPEPPVPLADETPDVTLSRPPAARIGFTYEDGPHDCEAVAVDTTMPAILLITKSPKRSLYLLPLPEPLSDQGDPLVMFSESAYKIAELPGLPQITGMDISSDGKWLVAVGYFTGYLYRRNEEESWGLAMRREPIQFFLPPLSQCEACAFDPAGEWIYLSSEKSPWPLWRINVDALQQK